MTLCMSMWRGMEEWPNSNGTGRSLSLWSGWASRPEKYTFGFDGIHWRNIDEDISFESFVYEDAQPTPMQKFFLTHKEINIAEFARSIGMNATLLRNYINGFKKPSVEREKAILAHIHQLGQELMAANF